MKGESPSCHVPSPFLIILKCSSQTPWLQLWRRIWFCQKLLRPLFLCWLRGRSRECREGVFKEHAPRSGIFYFTSTDKFLIACKTFLHIFTSPSSAKANIALPADENTPAPAPRRKASKNKPARKSVAAILGLIKVTPRAIAYACVQVSTAYCYCMMLFWCGSSCILHCQMPLFGPKSMPELTTVIFIISLLIISKFLRVKKLKNVSENY